jgi:GTP pyrophosphokinase
MNDTIERAEQFARKSHKGQKEVTGKPYVDHPIKVASLLKKWGQDNGVICAGLLHDVVEDCNISLKEIKNKFGERVAYLVDAMSFILRIRNGKRKKDMDATYKKFARAIKKEHSLAYIKTADMLSNIPNIHEPSHREFIINKSYPRLKMFWLPLIKEVGFKEEAKEIEKNFNKYTKRRVKSELYNYLSKEELKNIKKKINTQKHGGKNK